ncbi:MAG: hypothetical protein BMS9Abin12_0975 [Acidimicrobiia bacterium]|nr:MAG: hypothetical protein BMS9Abin12_0975 [Acidimicrobiia bacterium]
MNAFESDSHEEPVPLRDRMPDYLATFGVGLAATVVVGLTVWLISDVSLASSVGYTIILYGVVLLLAGGATGGGYTNLGVGAVGAMFGTRRTDEAQEELPESWRGGQRMDPRDRLRKGLRPEASTRAFWQVVGGGLYVAIGLATVVMWT